MKFKYENIYKEKKQKELRSFRHKLRVSQNNSAKYDSKLIIYSKFNPGYIVPQISSSNANFYKYRPSNIHKSMNGEKNCANIFGSAYDFSPNTYGGKKS